MKRVALLVVCLLGCSGSPVEPICEDVERRVSERVARLLEVSAEAECSVDGDAFLCRWRVCHGAALGIRAQGDTVRLSRLHRAIMDRDLLALVSADR